MRIAALLVPAALIATAAGAQVQPPAGPDGAGQPGGGPPPAMTRQNAIATADQHFAEMDTNHDGAVTPDEFSAYMAARYARRMGGDAPPPPPPGGPGGMADGGPPPPPPPPPPGDHGHRHGGMGGMGDRMFARIDANGDGRITPDEARAYAAQRFDQMDANHDGTITPDERRGGGGWGGGPPPMQPPQN